MDDAALRALVVRLLGEHDQHRIGSDSVIAQLRAAVTPPIPVAVPGGDAPLTPEEEAELARAQFVAFAHGAGISTPRLREACELALAARFGPLHPRPFTGDQWLDAAEDVFCGMTGRPSNRPARFDFREGDWASPYTPADRDLSAVERLARSKRPATVREVVCRTVQKVSPKTLVLYSKDGGDRVSREDWRLSTIADVIARFGLDDVPRIMRQGAVRG